MCGRHTNRGEKRIPTVSAAHKAEMRRIKSQDELDRLVLRLKMLGDSSLAVDRASIANKITKFIPDFQLSSPYRFSTHRYRALRWVVKESIRLIRIEKNPSVLFWLMRLATDCRGYHTREFPEYKDETIVPRLAISILEQRPEFLVRVAALYMIYWPSACRPSEMSNQLARICHDILVDFHARNGKLPDKPLENGCYYIWDNEWENAEVPMAIGILSTLLRLRGEEGRLQNFMHEMVRSKEVMGILFDAVITESPMKVRWRNNSDECIAYLLRYSRRIDREFLMREYGDELRKTFLGMDSYLLGEYLALHKHNVAEFFSNDRTLLEMIYRRMRSDKNDDHILILATHLLKCGLQMGDEMLQRMLGLGFLYSARHNAALDNDYDDDEADTYRRVLAAHPEWKQRFREITEVEDPISHTAQLGQTIPARVAKPAEYTLE